MDSKKRFFYVISNITNRSVVTSAAYRADGTFFNAKELRQQIANKNFVDVDSVYITSWQEFDNEQDYIKFFK